MARHPIRGIVLALPFLSAVPTPGAGQWVDVTPPVLLESRQAVGVAWADYDGDGDLDLYVTQHGEPNLLLRNDGSGNLTEITNATLGDAALSIGPAWGDFDQDGRIDLCWANDEGGGSRLVRNLGGGLFLDVTEQPLAGTFFDHAVSWIDYDGDGDLDLYVGGHEPNRLLRNDGSAAFVAVSSGPLADPTVTYGVCWGDYDDDGDPDVYLTNHGPNRLLRNDGGGTFFDVTIGPLGDDGWGRGSAWADYDNDGDLDLYLCNDGTANRLFRNEGGTLVEATPAALASEGHSKGMAWADFDNDGDLDVYVTGRLANRYLRNDGGTVFVDDTSGPLAGQQLGEGTAWGDIDDDGDLDLVFAGLNGPSRVFRNESVNGNHWLRVGLSGNVSNRAGVGARVRIDTPSGVQIREITAGSGWSSQNPPYAHFGLGTETTVQSITIRWPSGIVQVVEGVPIDTQVVIPEQPGVTGIATQSPRSNQPVLHPAAPNPFNPQTWIGFDLPEEATVVLEVFDLQGRRVRTLLGGIALSAGYHGSSWDGRDDQGARLSSGVYVYHLRAGHWSASGNVSLVK